MAKILIVDDSKTSRTVLKNIVEGAGHTVIGQACNGEEGFLMFKELNPDIVTMDITMPKMDGIESLKLIKHIAPEAKVIMITAAGQQSKMLEAVKSGATEFLTKPFNDAEIIKVLSEIQE